MALYEVERVLQGAITAALPGRVYWREAPKEAALPLYIAQPQAPIEAWEWVGDVGATGLVTVRALAITDTAAQAMIEAAGPLMEALTASGYRIQARYRSTPYIPNAEGAVTRASIWRISITQE